MVNTIDSTLSEPNAKITQPELLISAVLHLMSHYTAHVQETKGCTKLASVIERHLKAIAELPNLEPVLKATCQQLSEQWATIVENTMRRQHKAPLLSRLILGTRAANI